MLPTLAILAGGSGTRFWPAGRTRRPKQVLALDGDDPRSLFQATLERVGPLSDRPPLVVAPAPLARALRAAAGGRPYDLVPEPAARNTTAAVALAVLEARRRSPEAPVLVVPADHHVAPLARYRAALKAMAARAAASPVLVTLGLVPDRPATEYGWLHLGPRLGGPAALPVHRVLRYVEKPSAARARRLYAHPRYRWNLGTFAFQPEAFLAALRASQPSVARPLEEADARPSARARRRATARAFAGLPSLSVDHGVMERSRGLECVVATLSWDDLGSWDAVARHRKPDARGNAVRGAATLVDAADCVVDVSAGHVALLGVRDLIVVRTADTVLVLPRGQGQRVREVVERLRAQGRDDLVR